MSNESNSHNPRVDYASPDWHRIVEFLTEEKNDLVRSVLDSQVSERKADFYRGRILQIEQILDWAPQAGR